MKDPSKLFQLESLWVRRHFDQAASNFQQAKVLHQEVLQRMMERLQYIKLQPKQIIDLGCNDGESISQLRRCYSEAAIIGLDLSTAMLQRLRHKHWWWRRPMTACTSLTALPLPDDCCDLLFSNLALHWSPDLDATLRELHRVLRPGGLLMFSTLGPDTLRELRESWAEVDTNIHVHAFADMHDIGDALLRMRFIEPVMDAEFMTLTYQQMTDLAEDLRYTGSQLAVHGRRATLTGTKRWAAMLECYERRRQTDDRLPATFEVIQGHAWMPTTTLSQQQIDGTATFPLAKLRLPRQQC